MIISASRRTDLPALYADWFIRRVRAGFCVVPNPFNARQISTVSLSPELVDAVVFWSRYPRPLARRLDELGPLADRCAFLLTLVDYPRAMEPRTPPLTARLDSFLELAHRIGPERVVWRYDPIVLSSLTDPAIHLRTFETLSRQLEGATRRVIVSVMDPYARAKKRLAALGAAGLELCPKPEDAVVRKLLGEMSRLASSRGMTMHSCAQEQDYSAQGVCPGACIDAGWLNTLFDITVPQTPDPGQRRHCRCAPSRDIGMYDSCTFGCAYCYATTDFELSRRNHARHDPDSPSLLPLHTAQPKGGGSPPAVQLPLL